MPEPPMIPSTAFVIASLRFRLRLHHVERLAGELALAVPELEGPLSRHQLPVLLEHITAIVDLADGREQRMLAARLVAGSLGVFEAGCGVKRHRGELDGRAIGASHDAIAHAEMHADLGLDASRRLDEPGVAEDVAL